MVQEEQANVRARSRSPIKREGDVDKEFFTKSEWEAKADGFIFAQASKRGWKVHPRSSYTKAIDIYDRYGNPVMTETKRQAHRKPTSSDWQQMIIADAIDFILTHDKKTNETLI